MRGFFITRDPTMTSKNGGPRISEKTTGTAALKQRLS
jgi:hypothetical protein